MNREAVIEQIYKRIDAPFDRLPAILENDSDLFYGETPPKTVEQILRFKRWRRDRVFYDLGSGRGSVVLQAGMYSGVHGTFDLAVGIELSPKRHKVALQALEIAQKERLLKANVEFRQVSFLSSNFSDGDLIYVNSTSLQDRTIADLEKSLDLIKLGARVILVDRSLTLDSFSQIGELILPVNFQRANLNIYEKTK